MDSLKCQTFTVSPAEPGDFPIWLRGSPSGYASRWVRVSGFLGFVKWQRKGTPRAAKQLGGPEPEGPEVNATGIGGCGEATTG